MASYNIEISYLNEQGSYDILYPKVKLSNNDGATLDGSNISGTLSTSQIPNLSANKITSGTFSSARIPSINISSGTTGQLPSSRIDGLSSGINLEYGSYTGTGQSLKDSDKNKLFSINGLCKIGFMTTYIFSTSNSRNYPCVSFIRYNSFETNFYTLINTFSSAITSTVGPQSVGTFSFVASNDGIYFYNPKISGTTFTVVATDYYCIIY